MSSVSRNDLKALAESKLADARLLLEHRRHASAYYLSGYVIELALKSIIAARIAANTLPDPDFIRSVYTHKLQELVRLALLSPALEEDKRRNPRLNANWAIVSNWNVESRYQLVDAVTAVAMVNAVAEEPEGVFKWLQNHW